MKTHYVTSNLRHIYSQILEGKYVKKKNTDTPLIG